MLMLMLSNANANAKYDNAMKRVFYCAFSHSNDDVAIEVADKEKQRRFLRWSTANFEAPKGSKLYTG